MQVQGAVQKAEAAFGPCDVMICNAGATEPGARPMLQLGNIPELAFALANKLTVLMWCRPL